MPLTHLPRRRAHAGATLIEILVTFLLLAFGLLALASLQSFSVSASANAANRAIASSLAAEMADVIRANPRGFAAGRYDSVIDSSTFYSSPGASEVNGSLLCAYPNCNTTTLATMELATIQTRVRASLRYGAVGLSRPGNSATQADIWIAWAEANTYADREISGGSDLGSTERTFDNCPATLRTLNPMPRCFYLRVTL
jgi:type IV pilus assembly protein PilV